MATITEQAEEKERLAALMQELKELEKRKKDVRSESPAIMNKALQGLIEKYNVPEITSKIGVAEWLDAPRPPEDAICSIESLSGKDMTEGDIQFLRDDVAQYYPKHCKVIKVRLEDGRIGVAVMGVTPQESTALTEMIKDEHAKQAALQELLAREKTRAQGAGSRDSDDREPLPGSAPQIPPNIENLVKKALDKNVPTNPDDYSMGAIMAPKIHKGGMLERK
jgi:hypothetical protein